MKITEICGNFNGAQKEMISVGLNDSDKNTFRHIGCEKSPEDETCRAGKTAACGGGMGIASFRERKTGTIFAPSQFEQVNFTVMYLVWYILIGLVAGFIAHMVSAAAKPSLVVNLIAGAAGALLGGWFISIIGLVPVKAIGTLLTAFFGAVIVLWIVAGIYSGSSKNKKSEVIDGQK